MGKQAEFPRLELLQEWSEPNRSWSRLEPVVLEQRARSPVYLSLSQETLFRPASDGMLQPWHACGPLPPKLPKPPYFPFFLSGGRTGYLDLSRKDQNGYGPSQITCTVWGPEEESSRTLFWESETRVWYCRLYLLDQGDFLTYSQRMGDGSFAQNLWELTRRSPDGEERWSVDVYGVTPLVRKNGVWLLTESKDDWRDYVWLDMEDGRERMRRRRRGHRKNFNFGVDADDLWVVESDGAGDSPLIHLRPDGTEATRACLPAPFTYVGWGIRGAVRQDLMVCGASDTDLALLNRDSLALLGMIDDRRKYRTLELDGAGRLWVYAGGMAEAYDRQLNLLDRRRLRGKPAGSHLDGEGNLCVVTYQAKEELVRVYRLS